MEENCHTQTEIWKDIPGWEGLYQGSNLGRVKSLARWIISGRGYGKHLVPEKILNPVKNWKGYLLVHLSKNGKSKMYSVHRIIAKTFIPIPEHLNGYTYDELQVDHIDGNPGNCVVTNLRWATNTENRNFEISKVRHSLAATNNKKLSKIIQQYTKEGVLVAEYPSIHEAERQTGLGRKEISNCCKAKKNYNTCGGFSWKYKEEAA